MADFYGEHADCAPLPEEQSSQPELARAVTGAGVKSPRDLFELLKKAWCVETCTPRMRAEWSEKNPTRGQCAVTSFLAQDIFGGEVYGIPLSDGGFHCFNVAGGCVFDLTSRQFQGGEDKFEYEIGKYPLQSREFHFKREEKKLRYELLKDRLLEAAQPNA